MKNATKPPKRKLLKFAQELGSGSRETPSSAPGDAADAVAPAPAKSAAIRRKAAVSVNPAPLKQPAPAASLKPTPGVANVVAPVVPNPAPQEQKKAPGGFFVIALIAIALFVAGPPLIVIAGALTYPFVILMTGLAIWKIYDLFRTPGER